MSLIDKINQTVHVIREVKAQYQNPCVLWSMGKDSTAMLELIKRSFFGEIPFDVVNIDTGLQFPEMYKFRDRISKEWDLKLKIYKNPELFNPIKDGHHKCCMNMKTKMLKQLINENQYDAVIVSIRRDEHEIRNVERITSPRDLKGNWVFVKEEQGTDTDIKSMSPVQLWDHIESDFGKGTDHVRIHPFLVRNYWTEIDIWNYIKKMGVPVNPLYFSNNENFRYRSLGCIPCTKPIRSYANTIEKIINELIMITTKERSGRNQDKEENLKTMRYLGYM